MIHRLLSFSLILKLLLSEEDCPSNSRHLAYSAQYLMSYYLLFYIIVRGNQATVAAPDLYLQGEHGMIKLDKEWGISYG